MHPRKPMFVLPCALFLAAASSIAVAKTRYVYLINDTKDRIESFAVAQENSGAWVPMIIGDDGLKPGSAEMLAIKYHEGEGCLYDAKIMLRGGKTFLHRHLDFCKNSTYHPGRYLRRAAAAQHELRVVQGGELP